MKDRDLSLDVLRCVGALVVMFAHTDPPAILFQLRNFGTPLLIVVSALSVIVVYRHRAFRAGRFLRQRLAKLTIPAWTFLTLFFAVVYVYARAIHKPFPFTEQQVLTSYLLDSGIGYVWIFKVYITIALLTPLMLSFRKAMAGNRTAYFGALLAAYAAYELVCALLNAHLQDAGLLGFVNNSVLVLVPYAVLFAYGLELDSLSARTVAAIGGTALAIFVAMAAAKYVQAGRFVPTQAFKYPPTLYYNAYGLFCVNTLYLLIRRTEFVRLPARAVVWLSSNLLWVYLWHIMGLYLWEHLVGPAQGQLARSLEALAFVVGFGVAATWSQQRVVEACRRLLPSRSFHNTGVKHTPT